MYLRDTNGIRKLQQDQHKERLNAWLHEHVPREIAIALLESFNISAYLKQTKAITISPEERIRLLCIFLEEERNAASLAEYPRSWQALQRIYDEARKLDPQNAQILVSNAISAMEFGETSNQNEPENIIALYGIAQSLLGQALDHDA